MKVRSRDGRWRAEVITLRYVPRPTQPGDPAEGDGEYILVKHASGFVGGYYRDPAALAEYAPLEEWEAVK